MVEAGENIGKVNVAWGEQETVTAQAAESYVILNKKSDDTEITKSVKMEDKVYAPVKKGDKLGEITFTQGDKTVKTVDIVAGENVEKKGFFGILLDILKMLLM